MKQRILRNGNSLAVTIPAKFVRITGIKPGAEVEAKVDLVAGKIVYSFTSTGQLNMLQK